MTFRRQWNNISEKKPVQNEGIEYRDFHVKSPDRKSSAIILLFFGEWAILKYAHPFRLRKKVNVKDRLGNIVLIND